MNLPEIPQPYDWILEGLLIVGLVWFVLKNDKPLRQAAEEIHFQHWIMILVILILLSSVITRIYWTDDAELRLQIAEIKQNIISGTMAILFCIVIIRYLLNQFRTRKELKGK